MRAWHVASSSGSIYDVQGTTFRRDLVRMPDSKVVGYSNLCEAVAIVIPGVQQFPNKSGDDP